MGTRITQNAQKGQETQFASQEKNAQAGDACNTTEAKQDSLTDRLDCPVPYRNPMASQALTVPGMRPFTKQLTHKPAVDQSGFLKADESSSSQNDSANNSQHANPPILNQPPQRQPNTVVREVQQPADAVVARPDRNSADAFGILPAQPAPARDPRVMDLPPVVWEAPSSEASESPPADTESFPSTGSPGFDSESTAGKTDVVSVDALPESSDTVPPVPKSSVEPSTDPEANQPPADALAKSPSSDADANTHPSTLEPEKTLPENSSPASDTSPAPDMESQIVQANSKDPVDPTTTDRDNEFQPSTFYLKNGTDDESDGSDPKDLKSNESGGDFSLSSDNPSQPPSQSGGSFTADSKQDKSPSNDPFDDQSEAAVDDSQTVATTEVPDTGSIAEASGDGFSFASFWPWLLLPLLLVLGWWWLKRRKRARRRKAAQAIRKPNDNRSRNFDMHADSISELEQQSDQSVATGSLSGMEDREFQSAPLNVEAGIEVDEAEFDRADIDEIQTDEVHSVDDYARQFQQDFHQNEDFQQSEQQPMVESDEGPAANRYALSDNPFDPEAISDDLIENAAVDSAEHSEYDQAEPESASLVDSAELAELHLRIEELTTAGEAAEADFSQAANQAEQRQAEIKNLRDVLEKSQTDRDALQASFDTLQQQLVTQRDDSEAELLLARAETEKARQELEDRIKAEKAAQVEEFQGRITELESSLTEASLLKQQVESSQAEESAAMAEMMMKMAEAENEKQAEQERIEKFEAELNETRTQLDLAESKLGDSTAELAAREAELAETFKALEEAMEHASTQEQTAQGASTEVQDLRSAREELDDEIEQLRKQISAEEETRNELVSARTGFQSSIAALSNQVAAAHVERDSAREQLTEQASALEQLQQEREQLVEALKTAEEQSVELEQQKSELAKVHQTNAELQQGLDQQRTERNGFEAELEKLKSTVHTESSELQILRDATAAAREDQTRMESQLIEARQLIQSQTEAAVRYADADLQITRLEKATHRYEQRSQELQDEITCRNEENEKLRSELDRQPGPEELESIDQLQRELEYAASELQRARHDVENSQQQRALLEEQYSLDVERMEDENSAALSQLEKIQEQLDLAQNQVEELAGHQSSEDDIRVIGELQDELEQIEEVRQELINQLNYSRRDQDIAISERNRLRKELAAEQEAKIEMESDLRSADAAAEMLSTEVADLQRQIRQLENSNRYTSSTNKKFPGAKSSALLRDLFYDSVNNQIDDDEPDFRHRPALPLSMPRIPGSIAEKIQPNSPAVATKRASESQAQALTDAQALLDNAPGLADASEVIDTDRADDETPIRRVVERPLDLKPLNAATETPRQTPHQGSRQGSRQTSRKAAPPKPRFVKPELPKRRPSKPVKTIQAPPQRAPRRDNLTELKGVGKQVQQKLYKEGLFTFEQLMGLDKAEIDRLASEIPGVSVDQLKHFRELATRLIRKRNK